MLGNRVILFLLVVFLLLSFLVGMLVTHYQAFPYQQIKIFKQRFFPEVTLIQNTAVYSNYYYRQVSQHQYLANNKYDVVFLGDSLTDEADWQSFFSHQQLPITIANFGIMGDTSAGVVDRLETIYKTEAKKVFLMIGINDLFQGKNHEKGVDDVFKNYRTIVEALTNKNIEVYIQSCLFVGPAYQYLNKHVNALNLKLQTLAKQNSAVLYIDLNKGLASSSLLNTDYSSDDIHLNAEGYRVWVDLIKGYVVNSR